MLTSLRAWQAYYSVQWNHLSVSPELIEGLLNQTFQQAFA